MKLVKKHHVVTVSNELLSQPMNYSLSERRLLAMVLSQIKPTYNRLPSKDLLDRLTTEELKEFYWKQQVGDVLTSEDTLSITLQNYATLFNLTTSNARVELNDAVLRLADRTIVVEDAKHLAYFRWVSTVVFDKETGAVHLRFTEAVLPYLQGLKKHFTSIPLSKVIELQSTYSWRFYEIYKMRQGENVYKEVEFSLDELYEMMSVPPSRREYRKFNERILKPVLKELKDKGVLVLQVHEKKFGKKVVELGFERATSL